MARKAKINRKTKETSIAVEANLDGKGSYKIKCLCRKPKNLMIEKAIKKWDISREKSFMIGDKISDKQAAKKAKIKFFYKKEKNLNTQIKNILK